jgi:hypothetical protein
MIDDRDDDWGEGVAWDGDDPGPPDSGAGRVPGASADGDGDGVDPGSLAEMEDSDGDQWNSSLDGRDIEVCCYDCMDGELNAYLRVSPEDMREVIRFLVATYKAYRSAAGDPRSYFGDGY